MLVKECICNFAKSASVLDIGCYDGALLKALGPNYATYGLEASRSASLVAAERGVTMVGTSISDIAGIEQSFDVVCAVDVIEHIPDPLSFLRDVSSKVRRGGIIVISTGNSDASAWRVFRSRFWYCSVPEHLSFVSIPWATRAAAELNLTLTSSSFSHSNNMKGFRLKHGLKLGLKMVATMIEALAIRPFSVNSKKLGPRFSLGVPGLFEDHILLIFTKPALVAG